MRGFIASCAVVALCYFAGVHQSVLGMMGFGSARFGISSHDPLGSPIKIDKTLKGKGFEGDFGILNSPRKISYTNPYDEKLYPDMTSVLLVTVGDEEYIQKIEGLFVGSQHGYSPQKPTMVELEMIALWKAVGGSKAKFNRVDDKPITIPWSPKFGKSFTFPQHHMEAPFSKEDVKGNWLYGESSPYEIITLELK